MFPQSPFPHPPPEVGIVSRLKIQYVLDCLKDNPPRIRNIKQYLLAALYNAPLTIENYYAAQIDHDQIGRASCRERV